MAEYIVKFKPLENYFFGNEKTFSFKGEENQGQKTNSYYITSEEMPMQTTFLGTLRYILLPEKKFESVGKYSDIIGTESFDIEKTDAQDFGKIKKVSPVFIIKGSQKLIPLPADHIEGNNKYTPFSDYKEIETPNGIKEYTTQYDAKKGVASGFMSLSDETVYKMSDIISRDIKTGNAKLVESDSLFKKEYCRLAKDCAFAVTAEIDAELEGEKCVAYLGQGKTAFNVSFEKCDIGLNEEIASVIPEKNVYVFGDTLIDNTIYDSASFAVTSVREYRSYKTKGTKVEKGSMLYNFVKAGSIFRCSDSKEKLMEKVKTDNYCKIGFNILIGGTKKCQ